MKPNAIPAGHLASVLTVALLVAACGKSDEVSEKKALPTQVAVKVNKDEISVHQVNAQLVRLGATAPEQQATAKRQIVDGLIDQTLLVQQAREQRLDRDPEVLAALESARHSLLAQAYLQKRVAASARPSEEDIRKYYKDNPALFSERRVFRILELATDLPPDRLPEVQAHIDKKKSLVEIGNALRDAGANVSSSGAVRAPEQLPLEFVARISQLADGQVAAFTNARSITVLQVIESQRQPLDEKEAQPLIDQFLTNQKREELTRAEIKRLRDVASIEYVGDYTKLVQETATSVAAPAAVVSEPGAAKEGKALEKGISGLR
jgi:EpsD family peptidyl-prolyl cis-trans isomerase